MSGYSMVLLCVGAVIGWLLATCFWSLYGLLARSRGLRSGSHSSPEELRRTLQA